MQEYYLKNMPLCVVCEKDLIENSMKAIMQTNLVTKSQMIIIAQIKLFTKRIYIDMI